MIINIVMAMFNVVDVRMSGISFVNNEHVLLSPWATLRSLAIYGNPANHVFAHNYDKPRMSALMQHWSGGVLKN
jgi:hypothetical protein